jgi:hypothetical protein
MGYSMLIDASNMFWATETFSAPAASPQTYVLGLLYDDKNQSGGWEPRDAGSANREGLGGVTYRVFESGRAGQVGGATTLDNGSFSFPAENGVYDMQFLTGDGDLWIRNVRLNGANVDVGDLEIHSEYAMPAADFDGSENVDGADLAVWTSAFGRGSAGDADSDGDSDGEDFLWWQRQAGAAAVSVSTNAPEPGAAALVTSALLVIWLRGRVRRRAPLTGKPRPDAAG